jgi:nucleotide-binding universal stress UspA family protein
MDGLKAAVVVGVDGSPQARAAVSWAVAEARDGDRPMRLVAVVDDQTRIHSQGQAQDALRLASAAIENQPVPVPFEGVVRFGSAPSVLLEESRLAAIICVGSAVRKCAPLGVTATTLAERAHCPVAVIRNTDAFTVRRGGGVVAVVLDDEPDNDAVVHQAMREGRLRHATVRQIDRRLHSWVRRFPDVHVDIVGAGTGPGTRDSHDRELPQLAVLGRHDAASVAGIVTPNCHPIVGYPDCSVLFVRGEDPAVAD